MCLHFTIQTEIRPLVVPYVYLFDHCNYPSHNYIEPQVFIKSLKEEEEEEEEEEKKAMSTRETCALIYTDFIKENNA